MSSRLDKMDKRKIIVLIMLLLSGCERKRSYACSRDFNPHKIYIDIDTVNDRISSLKVTESFELPYELLLDEERAADFRKQLDGSYHIEGNKLIRTYRIVPEDDFSIARTLEELKKEMYICD